VCSFNGGFSVAAARGGATHVTDLDISAHALAGAARNLARNRHFPAVARAQHETILADAFAWLESGPPRAFDLIVVDPPSLAPREADRARALSGYEHLLTQALRRLRPRGTLVAASCSAHIRAEEYFSLVRRTAARVLPRFHELWTARHAPDHPATFPEAEYLKSLALRAG
jgi:23S rRNA (cytosine1962-C5)-methyltransferase